MKISIAIGALAVAAIAGSANAAAVPVYDFGLTFNTPNPTSLANARSSSVTATGLWYSYLAVAFSLGSDVIASPGSMQFAVGSVVLASAGLQLESVAGANLLGVTAFDFNVTAYNGAATNWEVIANDINGRQVASALVSTSGTGQKTFAVSSFTQFQGSTGFDWSQVTSMNFDVYSTGAATSFTFDSWTAAVPAPGALALLGVAGLVGARRRRA
jgi:MYXO-CTERM domain-containing protein